MGVGTLGKGKREREKEKEKGGNVEYKREEKREKRI